jgi:hypothetical protein
MNLTDELERLAQLHQQGTLSDEEFALAKTKLLNSSTESAPTDQDRSIGEAANRYVSFQIVMGVIGLIVALIIFFGFFLPHLPGDHGDHIEFRQP